MRLQMRCASECPKVPMHCLDEMNLRIDPVVSARAVGIQSRVVQRNARVTG